MHACTITLSLSVCSVSVSGTFKDQNCLCSTKQGFTSIWHLESEWSGGIIRSHVVRCPAGDRLTRLIHWTLAASERLPEHVLYPLAFLRCLNGLTYRRPPRLNLSQWASRTTYSVLWSNPNVEHPTTIWMRARTLQSAFYWSAQSEVVCHPSSS